MLVRVENISSFFKWFPASAFFISLQIFFYIILQLPITPHDMIIEKMAGINLYIGKGEYWRLLTPIFLHTNIFHLLFNSLSIFIFGPFAEKALGKFKFVLCFLVCGFSGNAATFLIMPASYFHAGSSGAVFGLTGIYLAAVFIQKNIISFRLKEIIITLITIAPAIIIFQSHINMAAHVFGFLTGFAIGWIIGSRDPSKFILT
ncbi:rhomboid family intramembrane serine protease [Heyndrickxia acidicola]|uniref:Rhomboid family intramembrane serine protease n=1 Tax=Heyndrickxia acidicola TaxID=209389 RepID=A0ABU6MM32_9BACI|nr:rhomboid family intramembrane serine protease [Heyndrickxia acidicola]MED1205462.1 rhomboid family intramembrane serine protease [Heyndrickxia acidicola]